MLKINDEFKALIPPLSEDELEQLEQNILEDGIREPLVVWNDYLIDGHNRFTIAQKHGLKFDCIEKHFDDEGSAKEWMILNQFGRRNLSAYNRSLLALKLKPIFEKRAEKNLLQTGKNVGSKNKQACHNCDKLDEKVDTKTELSKVADVSHNTIARVQAIEREAPEEVKKKLSTGDMSINSGYEITKALQKMDEGKKEKFLNKVINEEKKVKEAINEIKKEEFKACIDKQKEDIATGVAIMPSGTFEAISIDPPWNYGTSYDGAGRRVANPYPEMTQSELLSLELPASENSVLFLWTTQRFIFDAHELLNAWGFNYRNIIVWDKEKIGMGDLFRMQCEFCLVGIKGKPVLDNDYKNRDIIREPRREHSRKPDAFFGMVDKLVVGRKLEYFSREKREGWEVFGNDVEKF